MAKYNGPHVKTTHQDSMVNIWQVRYRMRPGTIPEEGYNTGLGFYAAKVPLIMGKAAVLASVAGPTLRSMRVARWPGNTAAGSPLSRGTVE